MIRWIAECRDCALSRLTPLHSATLVRSFATHTERDLWRRTHMQAHPDHFVTTRIIEYEGAIEA